MGHDPTHPLTDSSARLLAAWATAMGAPPSPRSTGEWIHLVRASSDAVVSVRVGGVGLTVAPEHLADQVSRLDPVTLLDADLLAVALPGGASPFGTAELLTLGAAGHALNPRTDARAARPADVSSLRDHLAAEEWAESGLCDAERVWASGPSGEALAAAGFSRWSSDVAHFCVASASASRRRGHATAAASRAVSAALEEGLVPQWRSRRGNDASFRLALSLGFSPAGIQATALVSS